MTRAELAAEVARLSAEGKVQREIAAELGISRSYVGDLLSDPDGSVTRARKNGYRRPCPGYEHPCGRLMDGSNGANGPSLCARCDLEKRRAERYWTTERMVEAVHAWVQDHGRVPSAREWVTGSAKMGYPSSSLVVSRVGWSNLIRLAGYAPRKPVEHEPYRRSRESMIDAGVAWIRAGLRFPSSHGHGGTGLPARTTAIRMFGSWAEYRAACYEAAGVPVPPRRGRGPDKKPRKKPSIRSAPTMDGWS